jgi:hypothetical protein
LALQLASQGQVKTGGIGKNGGVRALGSAGADQLIQLASDARDVREYFDDANHGDRPLIYYGPHSGGLHAGAGASKELRSGMARLQDFHQPGGVQVPRSFASGDKDAHLSSSLSLLYGVSV